MKTFPNWRAVGRAMRWARQQDGVTVERKATKVRVLIHSTVVDHTWRRGDGRTVLVMHRSNLDVVDVYTGSDVSDLRMDDWDDAGQILRVLAALDLIPAELAQEHDERDERCTWCHRFGHAADQHPLPKGHPQYDAFHDASDDELLGIVIDALPPAEEPLCRCDFLGQGTPEHVRSGLCREVDA